MQIHTLAAFALTELAVALSPGPAVLLALTNGSRHCLLGGALGALGTEAGNAVWLGFSAAGLTTLLLASPLAFTAIRWVGASYLVYLGVRLMFSARASASRTVVPCAPGFALTGQALLTQLGNPKALLFFSALLPQFIDPQAPIAPQLIVLGALTVSIDFSVLLMYAWLADRGRHALGGSPIQRWFDRAAGTFLLAAGLKLAALARG